MVVDNYFLSIITCGGISLLSNVLLKKINILVAFIILILIFPYLNVTIISTVIGVIIGAFTIGGKSIGKNIAINRSNDILFKVYKIIYFLKKDR